MTVRVGFRVVPSVTGFVSVHGDQPDELAGVLVEIPPETGQRGAQPDDEQTLLPGDRYDEADVFVCVKTDDDDDLLIAITPTPSVGVRSCRGRYLAERDPNGFGTTCRRDAGKCRRNTARYSPSPSTALRRAPSPRRSLL